MPSVEISQFSGAASVKIPVEVPPGRLGIAPNLSLAYNNYLGNGWIGVGWNIDLGAIQRSTKFGLDYDADNYVASMSGSTVELTPRSDWGPGHYGARIEGALSKYYRNASTGDWEVVSRDGTRYYYGSSPASRQDFDGGTRVFKWCLDRVVDIHGNYMTVTYTKDQGEIYPDSIDYTGNEKTNLAPGNQVKFILEDRTDVYPVFTPYRQVRTAKRLKTVGILGSGRLVRAYRLLYTASGGTSRSLLSRVEHYGSDAVLDATGTVTSGTALPGTMLTWPADTPYWDRGASIQALSVNQGYTDGNTYPMVVGDFNGDGKTDVARVGGRAVSVYNTMPYPVDLLGAVTSPLGSTTSIRYGIDDPAYVTMTYDGFSRVIATTYPDGSSTGTSYQGLVRQVRDRNGNQTVSAYDVNNRLRQVRDPSGTVTEYTYDTLGNLTEVVAAKDEPEQNVTRMAYNSLSKKVSMTDPDMGTWAYTYDKAGNLASQQDAYDQRIVFMYDAANRLTREVYTYYVNREMDAAFLGYEVKAINTYDDPSVPYSTGMLTGTADSFSEAEQEDRVLSFDVMQRVTLSRKTVGDRAVTVAKTYDSAGRVTSRRFSTGISSDEKLFKYDYDLAGNLSAVREDISGVDRVHVQYADFTALGQPTVALFPKSDESFMRTVYTYNTKTSRLETLKTEKVVEQIPLATLQDLSYEYDPGGNITKLTDAVNDITHTYTYDALDRLLTAEGEGKNGYSRSYSYDRIGNITYKSDVGTYVYNYADKPHAARQAGDISIQYDLLGNMTKKTHSDGTTLDISWNPDNRPHIIRTSNSSHVRFTYDSAGMRVKKEDLLTGFTITYFGDYEQRGDTGVFHLFANGQRIASIRTDGKVQYYHANHLGSASLITDRDGNVRERIEYYPFGTYRARQDLDASFPDVNYTFTGQEDDDETGLYNYNARLYDPELGRFISADSIVPEPGNLQAFNRYSYCANNPLIYVDPSGNFPWVAFAIGAAIGALSAGVQSDWNLQAMAIGAIVGGISGSVFSGVEGAVAGLVKGSITNATVAGAVSGAAGGAAAGAVSGGLNAAIYGGDICQSMLTGAGFGAVIGGVMGSINALAKGQSVSGGISDSGQVKNPQSEIYNIVPISDKGMARPYAGYKCPSGVWSGAVITVGGELFAVGKSAGIYRVACWDAPIVAWLEVESIGTGMGLWGGVSGESIWVWGAYNAGDLAGTAGAFIGTGGAGAIGSGGSYSGFALGPSVSHSASRSISFGVGVGGGGGYYVGKAETSVLSVNWVY